MVGELPVAARAPGLAPRDGDALVLIGPFAPSLAGSELAKLRGELDRGLPSPDVDAVARALEFVRDRVRRGGIPAAHDVSDGGLACALAEMAIAGGVGLEIDLDELVELRGGSGESCLFGEGPGGVVLALAPHDQAALLEAARALGVEAIEIGRAGGDRIEISAAERDLSVAIADAERSWLSLGPRLEADPVRPE
jgi:phosphoribosylformylglycinamidine synthase subunit PurL